MVDLERVEESTPLSKIILGYEIEKVMEAALPIPAEAVGVGHLRGRLDPDVHPEAVEAGDGDPGLVGAEDHTVHHALVASVGEDLDLVPNKDLEGPLDDRHQHPGVGFRVEDL